MAEPFATARELARAIASRELSPVDAVESSSGELSATEPRLRSFVTVLADRALRDAKLAEAQGGSVSRRVRCSVCQSRSRI
jgi:Asp-tRNA(Asn)/Glu-tRNA(Gln) amidotransferase A subunit family amidase